MSLPQLRHVVTADHEYVFTTGFTIRERVAGEGFLARRRQRRMAGTRIACSLTPRPHTTHSILNLVRLHGEVRGYLGKSPWMPNHMGERFTGLTGHIDAMLAALATPDLNKTERAKLEAAAIATAEELLADLRELYDAMLAEAEREASQDGYGAAQQAFAALQAHRAVEAQAYRALAAEYDQFMGSAELV